MGLDTILKQARKAGFSESDIQRITDSYQKSNQLNTQLKSTAHTPKNLFEKDQKQYSGYADLTKSEKKTKKDIKQLRKDIADNKRLITGYKKDYRAAYWIDDSKKRKAQRKDLKSKIRQTRTSNKEKQEKIESLTEHLEDIAYTKGFVEGKAREAKTEFEVLAATVRRQADLKKSIHEKKKAFKTYLDVYLNKVDMNDPKANPFSPDCKYNAIITFFKNADKQPSLDDPLPEITPELLALMREVISMTRNDVRKAKAQEQAQKIQKMHEKFNQSKEDMTIVFTGVAQMMVQHFTAQRGSLARASSSVLQESIPLPAGHTPLLLPPARTLEQDNER